MKTKNLLKRSLLLIAGLFVMAFAVALSVKANLGVSPISCIPYILSLYFPFTIGSLTIAFNILLILLQIIIRRRKYKIIQLLQLPVVFLFGFFIDVAMFIIRDLVPSGYISMFTLCILSCLILAFGVFLEVKAKVTYLAGEGLAMAISETFNFEFGKSKISVDSTFVIIGVICSFFLLGELKGIREGTIIAALGVGYVVRIYARYINIFDKLVNESPESTNETTDIVSQKLVITIAREYGSGGHEIGTLIAKKLNVNFYDTQLIQLTAEESGYTKEYIEKHEQQLKSNLLYNLYESNYAYVNNQLPKLDALFLVQSKIIRDICEKEACVIVGRCADYILRDNPNCINIFIHANADYKKQRVIRNYNILENEAEKEIMRVDKYRENYCEHYTGRDWKNINNYHLSIDSSLASTEETADIIVNVIKNHFGKIKVVS